MRGDSIMLAALRRLRRSERGFAMPTVLMVIIAGMALGGVAVVASISAQRGSVRDQDSKDALAAADAGVQVALYRQNKIATTGNQACVVLNGSGDLVAGSPQADGWCPAQTASVGGRSYTYRVKPWTVVGNSQSGVKRQLEVVSTGTSDEVRRRIEVIASARDGSGVFGGSSAIGVDRVTIGSSSDVGFTNITTNAATNGDIVTEGSGLLCGDAHHGVGHSFSGNQCPGYNVFEEPLSLPPADPGTAWTINWNGRFFASTCANAPNCDVVQPSNAVSADCSSSNGNAGRVCWNATTRTLIMEGNSTLTLGGSGKPYSFCKLEMSGNSHILVAQGAVVTIIFHSPETCGLTGSPVTQINQTGNNRLTTTSGNPSDLRIVMVGSDSIPTAANLNGNSGATAGSEFTFYAPLTDVKLWGSTVYLGAVAGKTLTTGGNALFLGDDRATQAQLPISIVYRRDRYVECTGGTMPTGAGTHPDDSC